MGWCEWVILTTGDRPRELDRAVESVGRERAVVILNGVDPDDVDPTSRVVALPDNIGVPAGRDVGFSTTTASLVGFLDDDAAFRGDGIRRIGEEFRHDEALAVVSLRLVDENGETSSRHVPRPFGRGADVSGEVGTFLGGACVIRRTAYEAVGGYFADLFYGHEELELSWRLVDAGWKIRYTSDVHVFHPRTDIARHADGWRLTGRNRVLIARRTLPWSVAIPHVAIWLLVGTLRAGRERALASYVRGWVSGWRHQVTRRPVSWRAVWRLTRLGRPPIV